MKVRIEAECTPKEAREFLGLPDMAPLNERLVQELSGRFQAGGAALQPEELVRNWMSWGGQAQEQFRKLMQAAVSQAGQSGGEAAKPE